MIVKFLDKKFLAFFFRRLKPNNTDRYRQDFPYVSPCGPETNYVRCDDFPIVFTQLLNQEKQVIQDISEYGNTTTNSSGDIWLSYCGTGDLLLFPFQPQKLYMSANGRIYHQGPEKLGGVGLIKSSLAIALSNLFTYPDQAGATSNSTVIDTDSTVAVGSEPVGFNWQGIHFELDNCIKEQIDNR